MRWLVPRCKLYAFDNSAPKHKKKEWTIIREKNREDLCDVMAEHDLFPVAMSEDRDAHLPNMARLIAANGCALLQGPPGVGKTFFINNHLVPALEDAYPDIVIITCAPTHVASRLCNGSTLAHVMKHYKNPRNHCLIVDENSMLGTETIHKIERWLMLGNKFIFS